MRRLCFALACLALAACGGQEGISIQMFPVVNAAEAGPKAADWMELDFAGSVRAPAGRYYARPDTLLTEWSILTLKGAGQQDGVRGAAVRLNAYAERRFARLFADAPDKRLMVALRIDGRWADVSPLLRPPGDRLLLYGFTEEEFTRLQRYIETR